MAPKLSLQYSAERNRVVGIGWSLTGSSSITRGHKTLSSEGAVDGVDYDPAGADSDHYYLDGKKLVVIKGSYGQDNAEYRTEQDSFSQIISTTSNNALGPASFTVKLKNGLIRTYKPASVKRYSAKERP